jgi:hypothetical protein
LGRLGQQLDSRLKGLAPALTQPQMGVRAILLAIAIPSIIGMLALAWQASRGSLMVLLVFLPVALIVSLLAFGANEIAQFIAAQRVRGATLHHNWPLGVAIGILSIPFGFLYGLQVVTGVRPAAGAAPEAETGGASRRVVGRRTRSGEELDLVYEAEANGAASVQVAPGANASGRLGLSPAARIYFAGMAANLFLGAVFGLVYWLTGWPSMRLALFASMLVLAFTSVSEPPADGWPLLRRNAPLWLAIFTVAATLVTLLAIGII